MMNDTTLRQIAALKMMVSKGNQVWIWNHIARSSLPRRVRASTRRAQRKLPRPSRQAATGTRLGSGDLVDCLGDALLDRLGGLGRHPLSECPKLLVLRGDQVELLTRLLGRKLHHLGQRVQGNEPAGEFKSGIAVGAGHLDELEVVVR